MSDAPKAGKSTGGSERAAELERKNAALAAALRANLARRKAKTRALRDTTAETGATASHGEDQWTR